VAAAPSHASHWIFMAAPPRTHLPSISSLLLPFAVSRTTPSQMRTDEDDKEEEEARQAKGSRGGKIQPASGAYKPPARARNATEEQSVSCRVSLWWRTRRGDLWPRAPGSSPPSCSVAMLPAGSTHGRADFDLISIC
jgi:hypothetical protein